MRTLLLALLQGAAAASTVQEALLSAYTPVAAGALGNGACPCIDAWNRNLSNVNLDEASCPGGFLSDSGGCYPSTYGSDGCRAYDANATAECAVTAQSPPRWCTKSWCWVDPDDCNRPHQSSSFFEGATIDVPPATTGLKYSYETCGNLDAFTEETHASTLQKYTPLRVSLPGVDSGTGFTILSDAPGIRNTGWDGSVPRFFVAAMAAYNISWEFTNGDGSVSAESAAFPVSSSFTRCVHEVSLNNTDICLGNFWPTAERRMLAAFTSTQYNDEFIAIVRTQGAVVSRTTFGSWLYKPFQPFSNELWAVLVVTALFAGLVMWVIEGGTNDADFPDASRGVSEGMWKSLQIFGGGCDIRFGATTYLGKLVVIVFSFAVVVLMALYTAKVTTQLVTQVTEARKEISSFTQALETGQTMCAMEACSVGLRERYPTIVLSEQDKTIDSLLAMDAGNCSVVVLPTTDWRTACMGI